jgi:hypothetical protein
LRKLRSTRNSRVISIHTMKILVEDLFESLSCDDYEALYFDESFNVALGAALQMGRQLVRLERTSGRIVRHVCYEPKRDPESPANQAFGTSRASFVEELDYDRKERRGTWKTIPNLFTERVRNSGTIELLSAPNGTKRVVRGEVKVSLFGFGGIVERLIVAEIEKNYIATTKFTREWLANRAR